MPEALDPVLLGHLEDLARRSPAVATLSTGRVNRIASVGAEGARIETDNTDDKRSGPQLVPAWMLNTAWHHLTVTGSLENRYLVSEAGLNVKRSSAVCALLAHLPGVSVASSRPIVLRYAAG
jgi:hypothetical protein